MSQQQNTAVVIGPGEGHSVWAVADRLTFKIRSAHTAGEFVLAEAFIPPAGGPPPHIHLREDEMFYVLEGEVTFLLEDRTFAAGPGAAVYLPRGLIHTFTNRTAAPARALLWASPCNFESFMMEFGVPVTESPAAAPPVDPSLLRRLMDAADRYGLVILPEHRPVRTSESPMNGHPMPVLGQRVTLNLVSKMTGGRMCAATLDVAPGPGVLPHLHRREDETFYVIDGTLEFLIDGARRVAPKGTAVYVPRGTFHGFRAAGDAPARLLSIHTPGGFEHFFTEMGGLTITGAEPKEPAALVEILEKHGMEIPAVPVA